MIVMKKVYRKLLIGLYFSYRSIRWYDPSLISSADQYVYNL